MKTNNFNTSELSTTELRGTNGGLFFLLPAVIWVAAETAMVWTPLVAAGVKGWNDNK